MITTATIITLSRLVFLVPIGLLMAGGWTMNAIAFVFYVIAAISDWFDGYWARMNNEVSDLGRMLDPVVDKIFVATLFILLVGHHTISGLMVLCPIIILAREFLVSGLREFLGPQGITLPVTQAAKWKTGLQMVAIGLLIFPGMQTPGLFVLFVATLLTLYTGLVYARTAFKI